MAANVRRASRHVQLSTVAACRQQTVVHETGRSNGDTPAAVATQRLATQPTTTRLTLAILPAHCVLGDHRSVTADASAAVAAMPGHPITTLVHKACIVRADIARHAHIGSAGAVANLIGRPWIRRGVQRSHLHTTCRRDGHCPTNTHRKTTHNIDRPLPSHKPYPQLVTAMQAMVWVWGRAHRDFDIPSAGNVDRPFQAERES